MKILPKYNDLIFPVGVPILLICLASAFFFRAQMLISFRVHDLFLFVAIIIAISPWGKMRLGNDKPISFIRWLLTFLSAGIGIVFLYYGMIFVISRGLPIAVPDQLNVAKLSANYLIGLWGFFPWLLILLVGISMAYFAFVQKKGGKFSVPLQALFKSSKKDAITLLADFFARGAIFLSLTSTLAIINLLFLSFLLQLFGVPLISNLRFSTLTLVTVFMILPSTRYWEKSLRFLLREKISYSLIMLVYIAAVVILLLIAHILSDSFMANFSGWNDLRETLPALNWPQIWLIFSGMWWLSWIPLMSGLLVYLSRGFSIRKVIAGSLIVIFLLQGLLFLLTTPYAQNSNWLPFILPILGLFLILGFFFRQNYLVYEMRGTVPTAQFEKQRSLYSQLQKILQNATMLTVFYLLAGIFLPTLFSVIMILPFTLLAIMTIIALLVIIRH